MQPMSDLEKALPGCGHWKDGAPYSVRFQDDPLGIEGEYRIVCEKQIDTASGWRGCQDEGPRIEPQMVEEWFAAARRFASLTSPETIEKAAKALEGEALPWPASPARRYAIAEAVLRSVEEGTR